MAAPRVFHSLAESWDAGYETYDHLRDGHVVRKWTAHNTCEMAVVLNRPGAQLRELPDSAHFNFGAPFRKCDLIDPDQEC